VVDIKVFSKHQPAPTKDVTAFDFLELQRNVARILDVLPDIPILNGRLITGVELTGSFADDVIAHKLGRNWRGWKVTNMTFATVVGTPLTGQTEDRDKFLTIRSEVATTIDLWVF